MYLVVLFQFGIEFIGGAIPGRPSKMCGDDSCYGTEELDTVPIVLFKCDYAQLIWFARSHKKTSELVKVCLPSFCNPKCPILMKKIQTELKLKLRSNSQPAYKIYRKINRMKTFPATELCNFLKTFS